MISTQYDFLTVEDIFKKAISDGVLTEQEIWNEINGLGRFPADMTWGEALECTVTVGDDYFERPHERGVESILIEILAGREGIEYDHEVGIFIEETK